MSSAKLDENDIIEPLGQTKYDWLKMREFKHATRQEILLRLLALLVVLEQEQQTKSRYKEAC
jgi:hypothetical protein